MDFVTDIYVKDCNKKFYYHLVNSGNIETRIERYNGGIISLFKPVDIQYAKNWIVLTGHIPSNDQSVILCLLDEIQNDPSLWLKID
jgi:hypothetical protein